MNINIFCWIKNVSGTRWIEFKVKIKKLITCKINKFSLSCFEDKINNLDNGFNGFNALSVSA